MMQKTDVNGRNAHPAYTWLRKTSRLNGADIPGNFAKFLLNENGEMYDYYTPEYDPKFIDIDIKKLLRHPHTTKDEL